ncbi:MAG: amidohydrolase family protein [Terriglobia bacterium]
MIDAYNHLDITASDPLEDLRLQMVSAGIDRALIVETWAKNNYACLERLTASPSPQFRLALCFRPEESSGLPSRIFREAIVAALRVKTADLRRLGPLAEFLETSGKWLLPHAENGIKSLTSELVTVVKRHPRLHIYLPHMGWPRQDKKDDKSWEASMLELRQLPFLALGISAIPYFSREPYPHRDIEPFAARLIEAFGRRSVVAGTDYPLIEKSMYAEYLKLAHQWIRPAGGVRKSKFEETLFDEVTNLGACKERTNRES